MIRRTLRMGVIVGLVAGTVYALVRALRGPAAPAFERPASGAWPSLAGSAAGEPNGARPVSAAAAPPERENDPAWIAPAAGTCPAGHPIKAKLKSGIYHQPGGLSYERTVPDRCYVDAAAADADGLRPAKR